MQIKLGVQLKWFHRWKCEKWVFLKQRYKKTKWCKTVIWIEASFLFGERLWDETLERHILWTVTENLTQVLHKETHSPAALNNLNKSSTRAMGKVTFFTSFYNIFANPPQFSQGPPISYGVTILPIYDKSSHFFVIVTHFWCCTSSAAPRPFQWVGKEKE